VLNVVPIAGLIPYLLNSLLWSDATLKGPITALPDLLPDGLNEDIPIPAGDRPDARLGYGT